MSRSTTRSFRLGLLLALSAPVLVACGEDHTQGVSAAAVSTPTATPTPTEEPAAPATAQPAAAARTQLTIARERSSVGFTGAKVTASHDGTFGDFAGTIDLATSGDPTQSAVRVTIQMASMSIEPERLAGHLASADLLDFAQFPTAVFESTTIAAGSTERVGETAATHTITGNLTLHGQTRTITFPAVIEVTPAEVSARAEFSVNRQDFGIVYPGMPDDLIRDAVVIRFDVHAPRT